ncbi:uncharacterized protein LOC115033699 [Acyrthosiphon pisum]|uniref:Uncharacterized protein n=1 Tax=Acyrthosiphon pisum TaxID=7029 RepID=A0A8R2NLN0_ACYPI|nr:uncharacterized protein LOC115033699 [Acyrthosiphon pisum]
MRPKNSFSKNVIVNGHPVSGSIDSGSSAVLIRSTIARECGIAVRDAVCPLYTVGNVDQPGATTIGEGVADVTIDDVMGSDHKLKIVPDDSMPVDVLVGRTWLDLPHVNYSKQAGEIVFKTNSRMLTDVLAEILATDDGNIYVAGAELQPLVKDTKPPDGGDADEPLSEEEDDEINNRDQSDDEGDSQKPPNDEIRPEVQFRQPPEGVR